MNVDEIIEKFGLVCLSLVGMSLVVLILWKRLSEVLDARIGDAKRNAEGLLKVAQELLPENRTVTEATI